MDIDFPSYPLEQAANLRGRFVYAYRDKEGIFYVGKTINPGRRFQDNSRSYHYNLHLLKRLRESGDDVRLLILERDPDNLEAAEEVAIVKYASTLLNKVLNPYRAESGVGLELIGIYPQPLCVHCRAKVSVKKSKYCRKCLGALLGKTSGQSKQQLRDLCKQIQLEQK